MKLRFSRWHAWANRNQISEICEQGGVYIIARDERPGRRPNPSTENIIYIGQTTQIVRDRLNDFARACQNGQGHAGGNNYFDLHGAGSWEGERDSISVAIWTPSDDWDDEYDLSLRQLLNYVEAKLQAKFVGTHKRLPELNKKIG